MKPVVPPDVVAGLGNAIRELPRRIGVVSSIAQKDP